MTTSTVLHARETYSYYAHLMTHRGGVPRKVAPLRRFFKRMARRAERRGSRHLVEVEALNARCGTCHGLIECVCAENDWLESIFFGDDHDDFVEWQCSRSGALLDDSDDYDEGDDESFASDLAWREYADLLGEAGDSL